MASYPSSWAPETLWYCHMCHFGPNLYSVMKRCVNVLSSGLPCQHQICAQCEQFKDSSVSRSMRPWVTSTHPNRRSSDLKVRPANPVDSRRAMSGPEGSQDTTGSASVAPAMAASVIQRNWSIAELTNLDDSASDRDVSSDEGLQVTPPSDTSHEDGTDIPWQADLHVVSAVARRLVDDWASRYSATGTAPAAAVRTHAGGSQGSQAPNYRSQRNSADSHGAANTRKRGNHSDGNHSDTNDPSQQRKRQKANPDPDEDLPIVRLLACPYQKHDPQRYSERNVIEKEYRGCASCYLVNISRLKQHLYRVHQKPSLYCQRCFNAFESTALLRAHNRTQPACDESEPRFAEKMTDDQLSTIKRKQQGRSVEQKWFRIFGILFPNEPPPKSPYLGDDALQLEFDEFIRHFRRHAAAELYEEIRSGIASTIDLGFQEDYLLDLILQEAVTEVVQRLTSGPSLSRPHETVSPDSAEASTERHPPTSASPAHTPDPVFSRS